MTHKIEDLIRAYEEIHSACIEEAIPEYFYKKIVSEFAERRLNGASIVSIIEIIKELYLHEEIKKIKKSTRRY